MGHMEACLSCRFLASSYCLIINIPTAFKGAAAVEDRSNMNATFLLNDEAHAATFDAMWKAAGISGLPGHRSVGGYRAYMYNALPLESVQVLVDVMQALEKAI